MKNLSVIALIFLLAACNFARQPTVIEPPPTPSTVRSVQATAVPTVEREPRAIPVAEAAAASTEDNTETGSDVVTVAEEAAAATNCDDATELPMTRHTVNAELDFREQLVTAQQRIDYINRHSEPLNEMVLAIEPNRQPGVFMPETITLADGQPATFELTGRRLTIELPEPLQQDCALELHLNFQMRIPQIAAGLSGYVGFFGFGSRQINLSHALPMVAARLGNTWLLNDDPASVGEQTVNDLADWDVTLSVVGASEALIVAAPGEVTQPAESTWRIVQPASRDFALSMSERFKVSTVQTEQGVTIELYHFDDVVIQTESGPVDGASHVLEVAERSMSIYSDLFGPYPDDRFVIVQGDFPDGMEFSDLVFVSSDWFRTFDGQPTSYLTIITVHEVSHQWWYARVGSDQAQTPWLDESLSTYSEYIFYEEYYPELKDWWWRFRINTFIPEGFADGEVDSTVYEFASIRAYINVVYLRGARMLHDLRGDLGTEPFFEWLRLYAEAGDGKIATPDLMWSLLTPEQMNFTRETRELYLGAVDPDGEP